MSPGSKDVGDFELMAYVDEQLGASQAREVENFLAAHPNEAARVMADIHQRESLRMWASGKHDVSTRTALAGQRLQRAFDWRRRMQLGGAALAAVAFTGGGLAYGEMIDSDEPAAIHASLIDEAIAADQATTIRFALASQAENRPDDLSDLRRVAKVDLPSPTAAWKLNDAQLFPSDSGPAVQLAYDPPGKLTRVSLFAVRTDDPGSSAPTTVQRGGRDVVTWRNRQTAYAITGPTGASLAELARELALRPAA